MDWIEVALCEIAEYDEIYYLMECFEDDRKLVDEEKKLRKVIDFYLAQIEEMGIMNEFIELCDPEYLSEYFDNQ